MNNHVARRQFLKTVGAGVLAGGGMDLLGSAAAAAQSPVADRPARVPAAHSSWGVVHREDREGAYGTSRGVLQSRGVARQHDD